MHFECSHECITSILNLLQISSLFGTFWILYTHIYIYIFKLIFYFMYLFSYFMLCDQPNLKEIIFGTKPV